jgi:hypothetical protein
MSSFSKNMYTHGNGGFIRNQCCSGNAKIGIRDTPHARHVSKQNNESVLDLGAPKYILHHSRIAMASADGLVMKVGPMGDSYPLVANQSGHVVEPSLVSPSGVASVPSYTLPFSPMQWQVHPTRPDISNNAEALTVVIQDYAMVDQGNDWSAKPSTHSDDSLLFLASMASNSHPPRGFSPEEPTLYALMQPYQHGLSSKPQTHKGHRHHYKIHPGQRQRFVPSLCYRMGSVTAHADEVQPKLHSPTGSFHFPGCRPSIAAKSIGNHSVSTPGTTSDQPQSGYHSLAIASTTSLNDTFSVDFPTAVSIAMPSCSVATHTLPKLLAHPNDDRVLNSHQVLLRQQIEVFEATGEEMTAYVRGRSKRIHIGQMGIRCRHCKHVPPSQRQGGAVYFPISTMGIYQASQNLSTTHLQCGLCREMPESLRQQFADLIPSKVNASMVGRRYWSECARKMGLVDTDEGIRFADI